MFLTTHDPDHPTHPQATDESRVLAPSSIQKGRSIDGAYSVSEGTTTCTLIYAPVQVWDSRNGQLLRTQQGHKGMVTCLYFAATVKLLFSGSIDNTVGIWTEKGINLQV